MTDQLFADARDPGIVLGRLPVPPGARLRLAPCTIKTANEVVASWHRHSTPITQKVIAAVRVVEQRETVGVAILGFPVTRELDAGLAVGVRRVCVRDDAPKNACSMLYGAMCRAAGALGYLVAYTYTMASEDATSVRAAGFARDGETPAASWDRPGRPRDFLHHRVADRVRWIRPL
jgi:hypothetical protein